MRFLVLIKATPQSEAGEPPSKSMMENMGAFSQKLMAKNALLGGDGLKPSSAGSRITFTPGNPTVTSGPFPETKDLASGYWLLEAESKEDIITLLLEAPFERGEQIEIRPVYEMQDYAAWMQSN